MSRTSVGILLLCCPSFIPLSDIKGENKTLLLAVEIKGLATRQIEYREQQKAVLSVKFLLIKMILKVDVGVNSAGIHFMFHFLF